MFYEARRLFPASFFLIQEIILICAVTLEDASLFLNCITISKEYLVIFILFYREISSIND
jgi:hypothetical protein